MSDNPFVQYLPEKSAAASGDTGANPFAQHLPGNAKTAGGGFNLGAFERKAERVGKRAVDAVGGALKYGHDKPWEITQNVLGAGQRGLRATELGQFGNIGHAIMTPKEGPKLQKRLQQRLGITDPNNPYAGQARLVEDLLNDPLNVLPLGKIGSALKMIPGVEKVVSKVGHVIADSPLKVFNPDEYLRGLKPEDRPIFEATVNKAREAGHQITEADAEVIRRNAKEIRAGRMPGEVAALFVPPSEQAAGVIGRVRGSAPKASLGPSGLPVGGQTPTEIRPKSIEVQGIQPGSVMPKPRVGRKVGEVPQIKYAPPVDPENMLQLFNAPRRRPVGPISDLGTVRPQGAVRGIGPSKIAGAGEKTVIQRPSIFTQGLRTGTVKPRGAEAGLGPSGLPKTGPLSEPPIPAWQEALGEIRPGTRPQDVLKALREVRGPQQSAATKKAVTDLAHPAQDEMLQILSEQAAPQSQNALLRAGRYLTQRGNQAFLANPVPHTLNLANLAYNKYGLPTLAKGALNSARVAVGATGGKLGENISELEKLGAKSQYRNIFDEMGLTRIAGIPGTGGLASLANKAIIPLEKFSNLAQHKILNSTETGLRAAALEAERAGGRTGPAAAKRIHETFGTNAPTEAVQGISEIGGPFAHFHAQTAPASFVQTLAKNPARVANVQKLNRDTQHPGKPQYRSSVPSMSGSRATSDLGYWLNNLGPLGGAGLTAYETAHGKGGQAAADALGRFIPASAELSALVELARKKKGRAGETALQDLVTSIFGGYFQKP